MIWIPIILLLLALLGFAWNRKRFSEEYNHGICKESGKPWKIFDYDSQGGTGYTDGEDHYLWD